ncbi:GNAT family N-acetyltransferase [uncultured Draconibacterium sp.]|uniref:GNAT family N-acetyltransferase n=1 Tax=uncultured Draconibacterium sp. TaxID=1573823 RepID=UPI00326076C6
MLTIKKYSAEYKKNWDELVARSRNGTFLFYRDYLEYHKEKYNECSFLFFKKDKLLAVIPGNVNEQIFYTHEYLTYGGFIIDNTLKTADILLLFELLNKELRLLKIKEVVYKPIPFIYHQIPSQEDLYALFMLKAKRLACDISSSVFECNKIKFSNSRKDGIRKANKAGLVVEESDDYAGFWKILAANLQKKYSTLPVHSLDEITYLQNHFKQKIKLFVVKQKAEIVGGTVLFITGKVVHVQYIAANLEGRVTGALDLLFSELINTVCVSCEVFDFGKSTEQAGTVLNKNLIFQKEGFGARGVVYETYKYTL